MARLPLQLRVRHGLSAAAVRHGHVRERAAALRKVAGRTMAAVLGRRRPRVDAVAAGAVGPPRHRTCDHRRRGGRVGRGRQRRLAACEENVQHARVLGEAVDAAKSSGGRRPSARRHPRRGRVQDDSRHGAPGLVEVERRHRQRVVTPGWRLQTTQLMSENQLHCQHQT